MVVKEDERYFAIDHFEQPKNLILSNDHLFETYLHLMPKFGRYFLFPNEDDISLPVLPSAVAAHQIVVNTTRTLIDSIVFSLGKSLTAAANILR